MGGLNRTQISRLSSLLIPYYSYREYSPKINPRFSIWEVHLALSQIFRSDGEHFAASWEQQLSYQVSKRNPLGGEAYQALARAIRAFTLGQVDRAYQDYKTVKSIKCSTKMNEQALIGEIRCLRLKKDYESIGSLIDSYFEENISTRLALELEWELYCITASNEGDIEPMIRSVQKKGTHFQGVYILEAYLWALASSQRQWLARLPKLSTITRRKDLGVKDIPFFYKAVKCLLECQDSTVPFIIRIKSLGVIVKSTQDFVAIDRQMLFYVAAARWLAKSHSQTLAATVLGEYEGLSLKVSSGIHNDVLGLADDLIERQWYQFTG